MTSSSNTTFHSIDSKVSHTVHDIMMKYDQDLIVNRLQLNQNYPNPFNSSTTIEYDIPHDSFVRLELYDILGRRVKTVVNEMQLVGRYTVSLDAGNLSSGVYLYRLQAGRDVQTNKMTLVK